MEEFYRVYFGSPAIKMAIRVLLEIYELFILHQCMYYVPNVIYDRSKIFYL